MKRRFDSVKYELKLNWYNKSVFVFFTLMLLIFLLNFWNLINAFKGNSALYQHTYEEMKNSGENVEELLQQDAHIFEEQVEGGGLQQFIDNPLRYDYDNMVASFSDIQGRRIIVKLLEKTTLIFLGLLVGIYMIYISTYENSEKTLKTRLLLDHPLRVVMSKFCSGLIIITGVFCAALCLSWLISLVWSAYVIQPVKLNATASKLGVQETLHSVLISYLIVIVFAAIGFAIGLLFRKMSVGMLLFLLLHLLLPSMGKYDYKNLLMTIFKQGFELDIGSRITFINGVSFANAILALSGYILIILFISCLCYTLKKRRGICS